MMTTLPALLLAAQAALPAALPVPDCSLVPGWSQRGEARRYDPDTLFEYRNGGAEAYFTYGFTQMAGVTCADAAGNELAIDVSEMGDPDHAWGFFASNQAPGEDVGPARQVLPMSATLARGRYYVEIAVRPDGDHSTALRAFLDALLARLPGAAHVPEAASFFPREGLAPGSLRLVPESVLGLRQLKSGFVATYAAGRAFVVTEATTEAAGDTFAKLRAHLKAARPVRGLDVEAFAAEDPYLGGLIVFRKGRRVAGVANVAAGTDALPLARALAGRVPQ
jgi:hypothetical protein